MGEGRVQVKIPSIPAFEPWARVTTLGGGSGRGFAWIPQIDDEVLVAFAQNDVRAAYVLGGLWSTVDRPPITRRPAFLVKRVIKTGLASGVGHEVEFDDALQSITITTTTRSRRSRSIRCTIKLENAVGSLSIALDNETQTISITAAAKIELKAAQIAIEGAHGRHQGRHREPPVDGTLHGAGPADQVELRT